MPQAVRALLRLPQKITDEARRKFENVFQGMDGNDDDEISLEEFSQFVQVTHACTKLSSIKNQTPFLSAYDIVWLTKHPARVAAAYCDRQDVREKEARHKRRRHLSQTFEQHGAAHGEEHEITLQACVKLGVRAHAVTIAACGILTRTLACRGRRARWHCPAPHSVCFRADVHDVCACMCCA